MFISMGLGGLSLKELAKRVWAEMQDDEVLGRSAQLAYYFLLALFPALLFLVSLIGYFAGDNQQIRESLFGYLGAVLPGEASELVSKTVTDVTAGSGGGKLSFGILAALWAASNGMGAISESLNIAYDVKESRPWWKTRLVAIVLTLALALLIITSLVLVLYGHDIAEAVAVRFGLGAVFALVWKIVQWPVVLLAVLLAFALIYYLAPDIHDQDWKWVTPGSVVAVVLWLLVSFGFKIYLEFFNSYSATYGSLGAVIILMLWFYFTGTAILVGGEINAEIEHEMAKRGAPDAKEKGEKAPDSKQGGQPSGQGRSETAAKKKGAEKGARGGATHATRAVSSGADARRSFSFGKLAVALGSLAFSRLRKSADKPQR